MSSPTKSIAELAYYFGDTPLGLGFTLDEPQLKAMYLNLLAAASDKRVQDSAHPSFVEVIKQLSASEAESLAAVLKSPLHLPIIEIRVKSATADKPEAEGYQTVATHVLGWREGEEKIAEPVKAMFVDNWVRLGLVVWLVSSSGVMLLGVGRVGGCRAWPGVRPGRWW